jgi:hypothetical protein
MSTTEEQRSPEERAEAELQLKLQAARNYIITYAAQVFGSRKWRVRTTADWTETGELRLRAEPTTIQNYAVAVDFSRDDLLAVDQSRNHEEIDALPEGMIDTVFGGVSTHLIMMG